MSERGQAGNHRALVDAHAVARALGGDVVGRNRVQAPGPGHSRKDRSLSVKLEPDAADGFLVHSFAGDDPIVCKDYVRRALGLPAFGIAKHRPRRLQTQSAPGRVGGQRHVPGDNRSAKQLEKARWLWKQAAPIAGSPAETYLRVARSYSGELPSTVRYLKPRGRYPAAMIAAFGMARENEPGVLEIAPGEVAGVHLTRIRADGTGKAGTESDKVMIGSSTGSPIIVAPPNDLLGLAIAEGIEDALSWHAATGLGTWAAGAASRLPKLAAAVPRYVDSICIVPDNDDAGLKHATELAAALRAHGFHVELGRWPAIRNSEGPVQK
ncbi:toprim domain-containing protein [Bradyrhizobium sp. DOA9]|uniref:toprim domain-containing protein n=1 Tax=Bradyrhizobium sp. DOA9 TaxID=1126627 RepID=UPI0004682456|nr:toprim domain-containing protein [Bradyrhizobium sp. DOA9]GAJ31423.1 hypothetical protein BDOA9_0106020 [Bradyrhizobium sp. DOA9]